MGVNLFLKLSQDAQLAILLRVAIRVDRRGRRNRTKLDILSEQQNHRCCYCGVRFLDPPEWANTKKRRWKNALDGHPHMATVEHVIRLVDGGKREWDNEVAACADCNHRRHEVDACEFFARRQEIMADRRKNRAEKKAKDRTKRRHKQQARDALGTISDVWPRIKQPRPDRVFAPQYGKGRIIADHIW